MSNIEVYDKVSWHFPEGQNCPSLDAAKQHFIVVMDWLKENQLLSDEGKEALEAGIDSDFAITSTMLTTKGNKLFKKNYSDWLRSIDYMNKPNLTYFDDRFKMSKDS